VKCAKKITSRGGAGKGSGSKGCRGAEHGQACTRERTGAVAVRAALESAVQVGRGNEGNRQAEMANPTKCRDSLHLHGDCMCTPRRGYGLAGVNARALDSMPRLVHHGGPHVVSIAERLGSQASPTPCKGALKAG
jgi:hypothetical protein